jgi:hypothetical protein
MNALVTVSDDLYGSDAGIGVCLWNPEAGRSACNPNAEENPDVRSMGCGAQSLMGAHSPSGSVTVFIFTAYVTDDLEVCGGVAGAVSATFF